MKQGGRYHEEDSGVSPIVAAVMLIIAVLFVGGMAFVAFRSHIASLSKNADIKIQSADLTTTSSSSLFSVAVKNTGTVSLDEIEVHLSGLTESHFSSDFSGGTHENTVSGSLKLGNDYPKLRAFDNLLSDGEDTGTPIRNVWELQDIENNLSGDYYLTRDIDATGTENWNGGSGFDPIGNSNHPFSGTFDGNGYVIENLYIDRESGTYIGLFGYTGSDAIIENVGLENVNIRGSYDVGGLAGHNYWGTRVTNCYSTGEVSGSSDVGGLVGYNEDAQVTNCHSTCEVSGSDDVGGLSGHNHWGQVINCYSAGEVDGNSYVGGLVGSNTGNGRVINCYSAGKVSGSSYVGGLVGRNEDAPVDNSFWDNETSGQSLSEGGTGKTTKEMKTESTFTDVGWDFRDVWRMGGAPSGRWTSSWIDLGDTVNYSSLETTASIPGDAEASVRAQVSNDENEVLGETNFVNLKDGYNKIDSESLPAARYVRVVYKLVGGLTLVVKDYRLNYTFSLTISLGSSEPGQTVSDSTKLPADTASAGEKKIVKITTLVENEVVLKRTITATVHG